MNHTTVDTALQQLLDRAEITDLVSRLGASLDEGRFDDMRTLMVEEVTARTPGGAKEGRDAVVGMAQKNHRPEWGHEHVITNVLVDLHGDRATVRANLVVHSAPDGPPSPEAAPVPDGPPPLLAPEVTFMLGEVYGFDVVRTEEGWRFARVEATPVWRWGVRPQPV
jgi:hypothetical protein